MQPGTPLCSRPFQVALLAIAISACSGAPQPGTAQRHGAPDSTSPRTGAAGFAGAGHPWPVDTPRSNPPKDAAGPPPPSTREIQGYFTDTTTRTSVRFWKGPNDQAGSERLTRFTVEVDGAPGYSRVVSTIELIGVCRSSGKGLDQLLFSFYPERRGGGALGVLHYDAEKHRFMLGFSPRDARIDCTGDRALLPSGGALPCTCPWGDGPDDPRGTATAVATAGAREILILPEVSGGPPFTRGEAPDSSAH